MNTIRRTSLGLLALFAAVMAAGTPAAAQQPQRPSIVFIMGDDVRWANVVVYNQGMTAGRTPMMG